MGAAASVVATDTMPAAIMTTANEATGIQVRVRHGELRSTRDDPVHCDHATRDSGGAPHAIPVYAAEILDLYEMIIPPEAEPCLHVPDLRTSARSSTGATS
jgi:hypothetical protein